jgi:hypothetical protein
MNLLTNSETGRSGADARKFNLILTHATQQVNDFVNPRASITKDEYDKKALELKERQHEIDIKMKQYTKADESFRITVGYLLDLASRAYELFESSKVEEKRQLLGFVLSNMTLEKKKLVFNLKEPFDAIVDANSRSQWLPGSDSLPFSFCFAKLRGRGLKYSFAFERRLISFFGTNLRFSSLLWRAG